MGNPLHQLWRRIAAGDDEDGPESLVVLPDLGQRSSAGILLVLRRMRAPLIVLIVIFTISVLGLSLIPGVDDQGRPHRMGLFESLYFMSYTATTIGFGELPHPFTVEQRMWVTFTIFLSVLGWAYAVGSLLALSRDRAFRRALARRHFGRMVARLGEPFLLLVGYGSATRELARFLDDMGRRFVVIDRDETRVAAVDLDSYHADTPALHGEARDTTKLVLAGLGHPHCEGVVALTGDDETNLDVTMTASLLRPGLPVIARTSSREIAERMQAFGARQVVNPLDRFGDHLRILLRSPASYQLMIWLTSTPGTSLPPRRPRLPRGRWLVCGHGRFARELTADLRAEGLEVTVLDSETTQAQEIDAATVAAAVEHSTGFVAATENDTTNLWLLEAARRANPDVFLVSMQNQADNAPLFDAVGVDFGMVPAEVIAHEVLARIANPALMRFLPRVPHQGEEWSAELVARLVERCGNGTPDLFRVGLDEADAPALVPWLAGEGLRLGDLLRDPQQRERTLDAVPLALLRDDDAVLVPGYDHVLQPGDQLLLAGRPRVRTALDATMTHEPTAAYVVEDRFLASGWLWRKLAGQEPTRAG